MPTAKLQPSGKYKVRVYSHTDEHGKQHYKSFTASTKAECEQLADWLNELKVLREKIQKLLEKQEQSCDTCRHGRFGDKACINCRVGFPNHYEAEDEA